MAEAERVVARACALVGPDQILARQREEVGARVRLELGRDELGDIGARELAAANPRAQHWQAKVVAQTEDQVSARARCDGLLSFICAFLQDAPIKVVSSVAHVEDTVSVRFRPAMGQLRTQTGPLS